MAYTLFNENTTISLSKTKIPVPSSVTSPIQTDDDNDPGFMNFTFQHDFRPRKVYNINHWHWFIGAVILLVLFTIFLKWVCRMHAVRPTDDDVEPQSLGGDTDVVPLRARFTLRREERPEVVLEGLPYDPASEPMRRYEVSMPSTSATESSTAILVDQNIEDKSHDLERKLVSEQFVPEASTSDTETSPVTSVSAVLADTPQKASSSSTHCGELPESENVSDSVDIPEGRETSEPESSLPKIV